ncbi:MAG: hypothetical protein ACYTXY_34865 [Nostoc sp.]
MNPIIVDAQVLAQLELEQYVEEQAQDVAPEFEIDSVDDADFGALYRLWSGMRLLGTLDPCRLRWLVGGAAVQ